jgi:hypothetical protein
MVRDRLTDDHALIGVFIVAFLLASSRHQASFSSQSNREKRKERNRRNPISGLFSFFLKSGPVQTGRPLAGEGGRMAGGVSLSVARRPMAPIGLSVGLRMAECIAQCLNLEHELRHPASELCILGFEPLE